MKKYVKQWQRWSRFVGCFVVFALVGCCAVMQFNHYNYSVKIFNESSEAIVVDPFNIFDEGKFNTVAVGTVTAKGGASISSFFYTPNENLTIKWKSMVTGKTAQATVKLQLPKEFTKKNGSDIYFHIKQDQSVQVAYRVMDAKGNFTMFEQFPHRLAGKNRAGFMGVPNHPSVTQLMQNATTPVFKGGVDVTTYSYELGNGPYAPTDKDYFAGDKRF